MNDTYTRLITHCKDKAPTLSTASGRVFEMTCDVEYLEMPKQNPANGKYGKYLGQAATYRQANQESSIEYCWCITGYDFLNGVELSLSVQPACKEEKLHSINLALDEDEVASMASPGIIESWFEIFAQVVNDQGDIVATEELLSGITDPVQRSWFKELLISLKQQELASSEEMNRLKRELEALEEAHDEQVETYRQRIEPL